MITVQTNERSLEQLKSKAVTGVIFFDFMSYQFPEKGWNDFVVVLLCWWLSALKSIAVDIADDVDLSFMDGPLYVKVKKLKSGKCSVECINNASDNKSEFSGQYPLADILDAVLVAAENIYSVCVRNGWESDDLLELEKLIKEHH